MNATLAQKQQCLLSCRDHPMHFRSWESSLSWAYCSLIWDAEAESMAAAAAALAGTNRSVSSCKDVFPWPERVVPRLVELDSAMQNHSVVLARY